MNDSNTIRTRIQKAFEFLITDYNFKIDQKNYADDIYSTTVFKKKDWKILISTTAHGSKISLQLISPSEDFGFLSHFFKLADKTYSKKERKTKNIEESIQLYSGLLKAFEDEILKADSDKMKSILDLIKKEHDKWVKPLT